MPIALIATTAPATFAPNTAGRATSRMGTTSKPTASTPADPGCAFLAPISVDVLASFRGARLLHPKVFVGSSKEALRVAEAVQRELANDAEPVLWSQGVFRNTNVPIEDLMNAVKEFDFAIFVFLPEDSTAIREEQQLAVRDNVLFE